MSNDERIKRSNDGRESRAAEDTARKHDGLVSTAPTTKQSWAEKFQQEALPTAPAVPGYHLCWLSTTSQHDPIYKRVRLGYTPVTVDDIPEFVHYKVKSGENVGHISVNEMVLYKIPEDTYQEIMTHFHHEQPMEEQEKLAIREEQLMGEARDAKGRPLIKREGENPYTQKRAAPVF